MTKWIINAALMFGLVMGQQKKVIVKKMITEKGQTEQSVKISTDGDEMTIVVEQDGKAKTYTVNLPDKEALQELKEELADLDIDIQALVLDDHNFFTIHSGGYLGVQIQDLTDQLRTHFKVKGDHGVLVSEVVEDSPADKAGLMAGDVITDVGKKSVSSTSDLKKQISAIEPETDVKLTVVRKGRKKTFSVTLGSADKSFSWMGNMPGMKMHKKIMLKSGGDHDLKFFFKGGDDEDVDMLHMSKGAPGHIKMRMIGSGKHEDFGKELEELRQELKELKKEIKKLKKS